MTSLRDVVYDEMADEGEFTLCIGSSGGVPNTKAKAKPKAKGRSKANPLIVASKIRSSTLRSFTACESAAAAACHDGHDYVENAEEIERLTSGFQLLTLRLEALDLLLGNKSVSDDEDDDGPRPGRSTFDVVGEAVVEILQKDDFFREKNLSPDHIQSLAKMKQVRGSAIMNWAWASFGTGQFSLKQSKTYQRSTVQHLPPKNTKKLPTADGRRPCRYTRLGFATHSGGSANTWGITQGKHRPFADPCCISDSRVFGPEIPKSGFAEAKGFGG